MTGYHIKLFPVEPAFCALLNKVCEFRVCKNAEHPNCSIFSCHFTDNWRIDWMDFFSLSKINGGASIMWIKVHTHFVLNEICAKCYSRRLNGCDTHCQNERSLHGWECENETLFSVHMQSFCCAILLPLLNVSPKTFHYVHCLWKVSGLSACFTHKNAIFRFFSIYYYPTYSEMEFKSMQG